MNKLKIVLKAGPYLAAIALFLLVSFPAKAQIWNAPSGIRTIAIPTLPDIAIASLDQYGAVIYFNPASCNQVGQLATAFFMAHEYGHHYLGHVINRVQYANNPYVQQWLTLTAENDADAYAVRYWVQQGNYDVIRSGVTVMWNFNNAGDQTHPPSRERANNMAILFTQLTGQPLFNQ